MPTSLDPASAPYDSHMFFWFFESRGRDPDEAPLAVWFQGGPGAASIDQAVSGHSGPCIVQSDSATTKPNPWSWTEVANMLYIDQPVQTGFSYDVAVPGVVNTVTSEHDTTGATAPSGWTAIGATLASQDPAHTANATGNAARAIDHFLQLWFDE